MAVVSKKWLDLDPASSGYIDALQLPTGATGTPLIDIIEGQAVAMNILGMWLREYSSTQVEVQPGRITIQGALYTITSPIIVDIATNLRSGETLTQNTIYFLYARVVNDALEVTFSQESPRMDVQGNVATTYWTADPRMPLFHPLEGQGWRHLGQVYYQTSTIAPFGASGLTFWESDWVSIPGTSQTITVRHPWGRKPRSLELVFYTAMSEDSAITVINYEERYAAGWFSVNRYGIQTQTVDATTVQLRTLADGVFWNGDTQTWETTGYLKVFLREMWQ